MKKILALILVLCMVFALCACSGTVDDETQARIDEITDRIETLEAALAEAEAKSAEEAKEAPEEVPEEDNEAYLTADYSAEGYSVGVMLPSLSVEMMAQMADLIPTYFEEVGIECIVSEAGSDTDQIACIENFTTMGVDLIMAVVTNAASVEAAVTAAREAGTKVMFMSVAPEYEVDSYCMVDMAALGEATVELMNAWMDYEYADAEAGSVKAAALVFTSAGEAATKSQIILNGIEADERIDLVFQKETDGVVEANTAMTECLTTNPDIDLLVTFDDSGAIGANQVWVADSGIDYETAAIISGNYSNSLGELVDQAGTEASVVRGGVLQGGGTQEYYDFVFGMQTLLGLVEPNTVFTMPVQLVNSFGFES